MKSWFFVGGSVRKASFHCNKEKKRAKNGENDDIADFFNWGQFWEILGKQGWNLVIRAEWNFKFAKNEGVRLCYLFRFLTKGKSNVKLTTRGHYQKFRWCTEGFEKYAKCKNWVTCRDNPNWVPIGTFIPGHPSVKNAYFLFNFSSVCSILKFTLKNVTTTDKSVRVRFYALFVLFVHDCCVTNV